MPTFHPCIPLAMLWVSVAAGTSLAPEPAMATEEPRYEQLLEEGEISLRRYPPRIVAETEVTGTLDQASSSGFRRIASYIFGANHARGGSSSERIAMTAPVGMERGGGGWLVNFVMPAKYTMATLPQPDDTQVRLRRIPERTVAVIRFAGLVDEEKVAAKTKRLGEWMATRRLEAASAPQLARYNPPWTLPFLRRNEIQISCR